ncbi:MAG: cupin domain-containing protein [Elusimicrobia bacterium]|nr:cupin domain-containing protein [Elusimicrobiota bacterium]
MKTPIKKRNRISRGSISGLAAKCWGPLTTRDVGAARQFNISMLHESLLPRSSAPDVVHLKTKELVYIIQGRIKAFLNGKKFLFKNGDYFVIPAGMHHRFETDTEGAEALSIFVPPLGRVNFDARIVFEQKP